MAIKIRRAYTHFVVWNRKDKEDILFTNRGPIKWGMGSLRKLRNRDGTYLPLDVDGVKVSSDGFSKKEAIKGFNQLSEKFTDRSKDKIFIVTQTYIEKILTPEISPEEAFGGYIPKKKDLPDGMEVDDYIGIYSELYH